MYNEETVMRDLDAENEAGSLYSYNCGGGGGDFDDYSVDYSLYSENPGQGGGRNHHNHYGGKKGFKYNQKSPYECIGTDQYRTMIPLKNKGKSVPVEFYLTKYYPGITIRDAVTGHYEKAKVGKCDEDLYFKVKLSMGGDTCGHLYYSSPEDYERHWYTELSLDIKQKWFAKFTAELEKRDKEPPEMTVREYVLVH
jgi:hypothetical protein